MSMYTKVEIDNPESDSDDIWAEWFERVEFFEPYTYDGDHELTIEDSTKYQNDQVHGFALDYTSIYADATVTITEEWTGDEGPSIDVTVYEKGAAVTDRGQHSALVPDNLPQLIDAVRAAILTSEDVTLMSAAHNLITALDSTGPNA